MRSKWFLRGLGVGIVLTALLLCITYRSMDKHNNVIRQAKELGMVFPQNETTDVEETADERIGQNQPENASESAVSAHVEKQETAEEKKARQKLESSKDDIKNASAYQKNKNTFVVRNGLLSSSVAREMEEAGIIKDADAFDEFLEKKGYGRQVRSGTYKIPEGADFETIAKIITRQE